MAPTDADVQTSTDDVARGGRPRDDAREQAILDAAIEILSEVGYEGMSIEAVANRAKSSKATIYRRWPGKAELVAEAMRRRSEPMLEEFPDTGTLRGDLLAVVQRMIDGMNGIDGGLMCGLAVAARSDAEFGRLMSSYMHEHKLRSVSVLIARAQERGELPPTADPEILFKVAPGVVLFQQINGEPIDSTFADYLVDTIIIPLLRNQP